MHVGWIEVPAGRGEIGWLAFPDGMNVEGVFTAGHASEGKTDQDACRRLSKGRYADILALCVLERSLGSRGIFRGSALQECGPEQGNGAESQNPRRAQTQPEAMTIRRRLPLGRTLLLELIALTLVAAVAFLFVQHGVPYVAEP